MAQARITGHLRSQHDTKGADQVILGGAVVEIRSVQAGRDRLVALADGICFFFDEPWSLPGVVEVRPGPNPAQCKWNVGKQRWSVVGLDEFVALTAEMHSERGVDLLGVCCDQARRTSGTRKTAMRAD